MSRARLVPELLVSDIGRSLDFYLRVCDWRVLWQRPEEGFAYLGREGAELMLEEPSQQNHQIFQMLLLMEELTLKEGDQQMG